MVTLEARNVCKTFRGGTAAEVRALTDVSLTIPAGRFAALVGPSGSGKTTLLALLGALDRPSSGEVLFDGQELSRCSDVALARARRRVGFIFQSFSLLPGLPAWENVTYPLVPRGVPARRRYEVARSLLARLGLEGRLHAAARELSGGEQQRVAAARALAGEPDVLLADEPTSNLDEASAAALRGVFQELHRGGKTVVLSTHDPGLAALAEVRFELAGGRVVARSDLPGSAR
jgi:putative ABC transport system ATP-binding protein